VPCNLITSLERTLSAFSHLTENLKIKLLIKGKKYLQGNWDSLRIEQVMGNLLGNAIKYGRVNPIEITLSGSSEGVLFIVEDHGIGISETDCLHIFEAFQRAKEASRYPGLGLGLFICSEIVKAHGGDISVESKLGLGTKFTSKFPHNFKKIDGPT
jgi:signal transduction histidine kinase